MNCFFAFASAFPPKSEYLFLSRFALSIIFIENLAYVKKNVVTLPRKMSPGLTSPTA